VERTGFWAAWGSGVIVLAAVLVTIGGVELTHKESSQPLHPLSNLWIVLGLILALVGAGILCARGSIRFGIGGATVRADRLVRIGLGTPRTTRETCSLIFRLRCSDRA
jgi:hypothetical protein